MAEISIAGRNVGHGHIPFIIAEVGLAHEGSLGTAFAFVNAAAAAGADAVKFQTHIADAESTPREAFRVAFSPQDATRMDYWRRTSFTPHEWSLLKLHVEKHGLVFLSSPFSIEAAELLHKLDVAAWKIPSGEVTNVELLKFVAATGKPVLLSSGMSPWHELDEAVATVRAGGAPIAVFQCTSEYPVAPDRVGLNLLADYRERYGVPVGLSDHSGRVHAGLAAIALGASLLEVHLTLSRGMFGPDVSASLTPDAFRSLTEGARWIHTATHARVDKDAVAADLAPMKRLFEKSIVALRDLPPGHRLSRADLGLKKPGGGMPARSLDAVVGRTLKRLVARDAALANDDLE